MSGLLRNAIIAAGLLWLAVVPSPAAAEHPCDRDEPPEWCYYEPDEEPAPPPRAPRIRP
jgi:hypothetical protein